MKIIFAGKTSYQIMSEGKILVADFFPIFKNQDADNFICIQFLSEDVDKNHELAKLLQDKTLKITLETIDK